MLFELPTTIESYKMTFVLYFFLIRNSFRIFIFYLYKICRSARSTRVDHSRSDRSTNFFLLSSILFFLVLFSKCTANYPNLFAFVFHRTPGSRKITRRDSGTFASLSSVVKASSFYDRVLFIFSLSLSLSFTSSFTLSFFCFFLFVYFFNGS